MRPSDALRKYRQNAWLGLTVIVVGQDAFSRTGKFRTGVIQNHPSFPIGKFVEVSSFTTGSIRA